MKTTISSSFATFFVFLAVIFFSLRPLGLKAGESGEPLAWKVIKLPAEVEGDSAELQRGSSVGLPEPLTLPASVSFEMEIVGEPDEAYYVPHLVLATNDPDHTLRLAPTTDRTLNVFVEGAGERKRIHQSKIEFSASERLRYVIEMSPEAMSCRINGLVVYEHTLDEPLNFTGSFLVDAGAAPAVRLTALTGHRFKPTLVKVSPLFGDFAVLQRGKPITVFGEAPDGTPIEVSLGDHEANSVADSNGQWSVTLPAMEAGGPWELKIGNESETHVSKDILIGDVWFCTGQSNMQWPLSKTDGGAEAVQSSLNPKIRHFTVEQTPKPEPAEKIVTAGWALSSPETVKSFSAVGYFFGRMLERELDIPIGLVDISVGGTRIETWMPADAVAEAEKALGKKLVSAGEGTPERVLRNNLSHLYNGMIHPVRSFAGRGWIWYQGEANAFKAGEYGPMLSAMIAGWRRAWNDPEMPFYIVELAGFAGKAENPYPPERPGYAEIREVQRKVGASVPRAGSISITDLGDKHDIHPTNKKPVGERLAALALAETYGNKEAAPDFPFITDVIFNDNEAVVTVHPGKGKLVVKGDAIQGFDLRDASGSWFAANASLDGTRITLSHPGVPNPDAIRYNWANWTTGNVFSESGLPLVSHRTDTEPYHHESKPPRQPSQH